MKKLAAAALLLAGGCRTVPPQPETGRAAALRVPFYANTSDQCGPAALASVLSFWGAATEPETLRSELYRAKLRGSLPLDLTLAARRRGFKAAMYEGGLDDLRRRLDAGRPLVAFLNVGFELLPQGHFVVVTGYDDARGGVVMHSGTDAGRFLAYGRLEKLWRRTGRLTLLVEPS